MFDKPKVQAVFTSLKRMQMDNNDETIANTGYLVKLTLIIYPGEQSEVNMVNIWFSCEKRNNKYNDFH